MNQLPLLPLIILLVVFSTGHAQKAPNVDFEKKIREATPLDLPQSPAEKRIGTDARDDGLKGKVKSALEYSQQAGDRKRLIDKKTFYNEDGNWTKTVHYDEGYPQSVIVWGFIDGMRVNRSNDIIYAQREKPVSSRMMITASAEDNTKDNNAPRDQRYRMRFITRYDDRGRLVEKQNIQNNGEIWTRTAYTYDGNRREERNFGNDGNEWSRTAYILDTYGNVIEQLMYGEDNEPPLKYIMKHEFDPQRNWIVERTYEETTVRKRIALKLLWTSYRTIEYYP